MDEEFDLSESIENGIRDNAGQLAVAGALMAHSQRQNQLRALEATRLQQAEIAKTESERLAVEKKRLELESLRHETAKLEKEAVREIRLMMAEIGMTFDGLTSKGELKGAPQGLRRELAMAVHLSKLSLARARSECLSDLNDLKELIRLESQAQEIIDKYFGGKDPTQVAKEIWDKINFWTMAEQKISAEVREAISQVPEVNRVVLPSLSELGNIRINLETLLFDLNKRLMALAEQLPTDYFIDGQLLPELCEQLQLQDLIEGGKKNRVRSLNISLSSIPNSKDGSNSLQQEIKTAIREIKKWEEIADDHTRAIEKASTLLNSGYVTNAVKALNGLGKIRFQNLSYVIIRNLENVQKSLDEPKYKGERSHNLLQELKQQYPNADEQSELMIKINASAKRYKEENRIVLISTVAVLFIFILFLIGLALENAQEERAKAEARLKAELSAQALIKAEQIEAEAKAKAEQAAAAARLEAEAKAEREAADAMAKAEREAADAMAEAKRDQAEAMAKLSVKIGSGRVGQTLYVSLAGRMVMPFTFCPAGSFTMGSPASEEDRSSDENQVQVTITKAFWLAKTEVNQAQWKAIMTNNPSKFNGDDLPVENVSWNDAQAFINKVNASGMIPDGWKMALPTEAQWEYACRSGETGAYSGGNINQVAWHFNNSGSKTNTVGVKKSNSWGLNDMHGNVWEWCSDRHSELLLGGADPCGPSSGVLYVFRGGSWFNSAGCRAAVRRRALLVFRSDDLGFRPALVPSR